MLSAVVCWTRPRQDSSLKARSSKAFGILRVSLTSCAGRDKKRPARGKFRPCPTTPPRLTVLVKDTLADLVEAAAAHVRRAAAEAIAARGQFRIALAGGSTPRALYPRLVEGVDWTRTSVFFGDERAVGPTDPQSNYRMAQETLLGPAAVPARERAPVARARTPTWTPPRATTSAR